MKYLLLSAFTALLLVGCTVLSPREAAFAELKEKKIDFDKTSFIRAARNGDIETVKLFLDAGMPADYISIEEKENTGIASPLIAAIENNHTDVAKLLISKGAADNMPQVALIFAVSMGNAEITEDLLSRGTPIPDTMKEDKHSLLMIACGAGHELLIDDDYADDKDVLEFMNADIVAYLLEYGADVKERDKTGCTALHYACLFGRKDMADILIAAGAPVDNDIEIEFPGIGKLKSMPILVAAASSGDIALVKMLIGKGADINSAGSCFFPMLPSYKYIGKGVGNGFTPLHAACYAGQLSMVKYLISLGVDVNAKDANGKTPIMFARGNEVGINPMFMEPDKVKSKDPVVLVKLLVEHGAVINNDLLFEAVQNGHLKTVAFLLDKGLDVNCRNGENLTPLMVAGKFKHKELYDYLLKRGASASDKDKSGKTAEDYLNDESSDCDLMAIKKK